jgi:hypothetical protein
MKFKIISYDIFNLFENIFNRKIHNDDDDKIFDDLGTFFKYDICDYTNDFIEINPRFY